MGEAMKQCKRCDITILDDTSVCPLCNSVLLGEEKGENTYPDIMTELHRFALVRKILYFSLLVIGVVSVFLNYLTFQGMYWSAIVLAGCAYCFFTVSYTTMHRTNFGAKILWQALGILLILIVIDVVTGYRGWSVCYAAPGILLLCNLVLVILMIVNSSSWQGYFMCQIAVTLLSILPVWMAALHIVDNFLLSVITCGISFLVLAGIVIFGDRKVKNELKRRFHT